MLVQGEQEGGFLLWFTPALNAAGGSAWVFWMCLGLGGGQGYQGHSQCLRRLVRAEQCPSPADGHGVVPQLWGGPCPAARVTTHSLGLMLALQHSFAPSSRVDALQFSFFIFQILYCFSV